MADFGKGAELLELETVQRAIEESAQWAAAEWHRRTIGFARYFISRTGSSVVESPIEAAFAAWFWAANSVDMNLSTLSLLPQQTVQLSSGKTCRFDFAVTFTGDVAIEAEKRGVAQPLIAIELDGHDFHERTKEQVAERNQRDRDAQADGWAILHFSGSELYRDPLACVRSVTALAESKYQDWFSKVYGA